MGPKSSEVSTADLHSQFGNKPSMSAASRDMGNTSEGYGRRDWISGNQNFSGMGNPQVSSAFPSSYGAFGSYGVYPQYGYHPSSAPTTPQRRLEPTPWEVSDQFALQMANQLSNQSFQSQAQFSVLQQNPENCRSPGQSMIRSVSGIASSHISPQALVQLPVSQPQPAPHEGADGDALSPASPGNTSAFENPSQGLPRSRSSSSINQDPQAWTLARAQEAQVPDNRGQAQEKQLRNVHSDAGGPHKKHVPVAASSSAADGRRLHLDKGHESSFQGSGRGVRLQHDRRFERRGQRESHKDGNFASSGEAEPLVSQEADTSFKDTRASAAHGQQPDDLGPRKVAIEELEAIERAVQASAEAAGDTDAAEYERLLATVAPSVSAGPRSDGSRPTGSLEQITSDQWEPEGQGNAGPWAHLHKGNLLLQDLWLWYEEASVYGLGVRTLDPLRDDRPALAYFVPYLSGVQLFGRGQPPGGQPTGTVGVRQPAESSPPVASREELLAGSTTVAAKGSKPLEIGERPDEGLNTAIEAMADLHLREDGAQGGVLPDPSLPGAAGLASGRALRGSGECEDELSVDVELLYQFFETDPPSHRTPLLFRVNALAARDGSAAILSSARLSELHPASWFAVAWYPIYRISDGPLRAVFLTFHSLGQVVPTSTPASRNAAPGVVSRSISLPVVGLEWYNAQSEHWFGAKVSGRRPGPYRGAGKEVLLSRRLVALQAAASAMARGPQLRNSSSAPQAETQNQHSDFEFFRSRRAL